jgi:predicted DNA-binding transcriptional regulator AlpA
MEDIDAGNSNLTEDELLEVITVLKRLSDKEIRVSKYSACKYLNMSRANFDNKVREGKIPKGEKSPGFKELSWSKKELDDYIALERNSNNQSLLRKQQSKLATQATIKACLKAIIEFVEIIEYKNMPYDNSEKTCNTNI